MSHETGGNAGLLESEEKTQKPFPSLATDLGIAKERRLPHSHREYAIAGHGDDSSSVSEFTQSQHDVDPSQTCSDKSNRPVGI
jgi:hypothetical protein